jgi:hypothetical protein
MVLVLLSFSHIWTLRLKKKYIFYCNCYYLFTYSNKPWDLTHQRCAEKMEFPRKKIRGNWNNAHKYNDPQWLPFRKLNITFFFATKKSHKKYNFIKFYVFVFLSLYIQYYESLMIKTFFKKVMEDKKIRNLKSKSYLNWKHSDVYKLNLDIRAT